MPVYSKKQLRRILGARYTHDMVLPAQQNSVVGFGGANIGLNFGLGAARWINLGASGQNLLQNAWVYYEGSFTTPDGAPTMYQYTIGSYNVGSGGFGINEVAQDWHSATTGGMFEIHTRVSPIDKDAAIDDTIKRIRLRQEVAIPTIDGALFYTIDGAASPFIIDKILDVHIFANPTGSQDRDYRHVGDWQVVTTATGNEFRLQRALMGSQQLVFDAILIPSLGNEQATLNIPDERWILAGAAARCYDFIIQSAPAQQVALLQQRRQEMALEFTRLSTRFQPVVDKPIRLNDVVRGGGQYPTNQGGWW